MTDTLPRVVVPYADFLERRERRRRIAAEVEQPEAQRPIDVEVESVAGARPLLRDKKQRNEAPDRVKNPERAT
jgi:hypothetical protein